MNEEIKQTITGLLWSVRQLQKLIPDGASWDAKANAIANHAAAAEIILEMVNVAKFPFKATFHHSGNTFIPTGIDYENRAVWYQKSQVSGDGEWIPFDDVEIEKNPYYVGII